MKKKTNTQNPPKNNEIIADGPNWMKHLLSSGGFLFATDKGRILPVLVNANVKDMLLSVVAFVASAAKSADDLEIAQKYVHICFDNCIKVMHADKPAKKAPVKKAAAKKAPAKKGKTNV